MGNYWSGAYPDNAPKYRLDWRPDIRTNNDNRLVIRFRRYDIQADISKQVVGPDEDKSISISNSIPPQPFDNLATITYHCGAAYAVALAYTIALKCLDTKKKLQISKNTEEIIKHGASTAYLYWNAREYEGITDGADVGCSIRSCLYVMLEKGMVSEKEFPLSYYGVAKDPYWLHTKAAANKEIIGTPEIFRLTKDPKAIIQALQNKNPVIIGYTLHEKMFNENFEKSDILKYSEQEKKDESKIRGGYVGIIIKYEPEIRQFLVHGTPYPGRDKMFVSSDTIRSPSIGDIWCIKISSNCVSK